MHPKPSTMGTSDHSQAQILLISSCRPMPTCFAEHGFWKSGFWKSANDQLALLPDATLPSAANHLTRFSLGQAIWLLCRCDCNVPLSCSFGRLPLLLSLGRSSASLCTSST